MSLFPGPYKILEVTNNNIVASDGTTVFISGYAIPADMEDKIAAEICALLNAGWEAKQRQRRIYCDHPGCGKDTPAGTLNHAAFKAGLGGKTFCDEHTTGKMRMYRGMAESIKSPEQRIARDLGIPTPDESHVAASHALAEDIAEIKARHEPGVGQPVV